MTLDWSPIEAELDAFRAQRERAVREAARRRGRELDDDMDAGAEDVAAEYGADPWAIGVLSEVARGRG